MHRSLLYGIQVLLVAASLLTSGCPVAPPPPETLDVVLPGEVKQTVAAGTGPELLAGGAWAGWTREIFMAVTAACIAGEEIYRQWDAGRIAGERIGVRQTPFGASSEMFLVGQPGPSYYLLPRHGVGDDGKQVGRPSLMGRGGQADQHHGDPQIGHL